MKREQYTSEKNAATARETTWRWVAFGLLGANLFLAMTVSGTDTTEKTIIVPPTVERAFWVKGSEVSPEYLEEFSRYLSTLLLNITPKSVDGNTEAFLRYVAPESYGEIRTKIRVKADKLKLDSISTAFYPVEYRTKAGEKQVAVYGDFVSMIGKQAMPPVRRTFRFSYSFINGRLWVTDIVEVDSEHPFETAIDDVAVNSVVGQ